MKQSCSCCRHGGDAKGDVDNAGAKDAAGCEGVAAAAAAAWWRVCVISRRICVDDEIDLRGHKGERENEGRQGQSEAASTGSKQDSIQNPKP